MLTTVCLAMTVAHSAPALMPARIRLPTNAVWATVIFALNIVAFIFIGLQVRPILADLTASERDRYMLVDAVVLLTVIAVNAAASRFVARGPRGTRKSRTRDGRRAAVGCLRGWIVYGWCAWAI